MTDTIKVPVCNLPHHPQLAAIVESLGLNLPDDYTLKFEDADSAGTYHHKTRTLRLYRQAYDDLLAPETVIQNFEQGQDICPALHAIAVLLHENVHRLQFIDGLNKIWRSGSNGLFLQYSLINTIAEAQAECQVIEWFYDHFSPALYTVAADNETLFRSMWQAYTMARPTSRQQARRVAFWSWLDDPEIRAVFGPMMARKQFAFYGYPRRPVRFPKLKKVAAAETALPGYLDWLHLETSDLVPVYEKLNRAIKYHTIKGLPLTGQKYMVRHYPEDQINLNNFLLCTS